jgi:hypothetical protein
MCIETNKVTAAAATVTTMNGIAHDVQLCTTFWILKGPKSHKTSLWKCVLTLDGQFEPSHHETLYMGRQSSMCEISPRAITIGTKIE